MKKSVLTPIPSPGAVGPGQDGFPWANFAGGGKKVCLDRWKKIPPYVFTILGTLNVQFGLFGM